MKKRIDIDTTLHTDPKFNFLSKNNYKFFLKIPQKLYLQ